MGKLQVIILCLLLSFFMIALTSAEDEVLTFAQNTKGDIRHPVRVNDGISTNVNCNITVYNVNGTILINFTKMQNNYDYFNYTLNTSQTSVKGIYKYDISCSDGTLNRTESFPLIINLGGIQPSQSRTQTLTRTVWVFIALGVLFFISLFFIKSVPIKLTMLLLMIWFILMAINTSFLSIQDEVINTRVETFFSFFLTISFYANWLIFSAIAILWVITAIVNSISIQQKRRQERYG